MTSVTRRNASHKDQQHNASTPGTKALVAIEPHRLWTIKVLNRFNIITKDELAVLLEQYLESLNKIKANISKASEEESDNYLTSLEPTKWKDQDHYLVLGLQHLRYKATDDDIRRAHRRKALKHHPDKRSKKQADKVDLENDYYSCITRAMDILGDPIKRRSFDSVDPTFDDSIPNPIKSTKLEQDQSLFYRTFGPVFESNARWSSARYVPQLGNSYSSREQVENFYSFWYNMQSWREFSYLDEEDKEKGENRDERRWLDRQNKTARQQRKKTENARMRQLVDNAYSCDPRISKFKEQDRQKKLDVKRARQEEAKARVDREAAERQKQEDEERLKKAQIEEEEKEKRMKEKKQREQAKKESRKLIKSLESMFQENDYFTSNLRDKVKHIEDLDKITRLLSTIEIKEFKDELESNADFTFRQKVFLNRVNKVNERIEEEKRASLTTHVSAGATNGNDKPKTPGWTEDEIKLLVKAVSIFPAGTKDRWDVIAKYMAQHSADQVQRDAKQVLSKVKQIQEQLARRRA